ncbi:LANO_0H10308g1_1 [Lachancea nothofagi CBS 11611]|uniref:LANO_0H10308g1_1 n=1 Tax=Lachancea nothofagi CBS 11611 TaxID=1266666 RepID=A0A1G4KLW7_9SACH|nr:LANO_0H10308g1_1 [Lachancea nothofagi CBS 11611]
MSNFFRDSAHGFKPRSNIFSKFRNKDAGQDCLPNSDNVYLGCDGAFSSDKNSLLDFSDSRILANDTSASSLINESTPVAKSRGRVPASNSEEEELEITEVRHVSQRELKQELSNHSDSPPKAQVAKLKLAQDSNDTSTNDVLLEAFNNTQKICSNLKLELQRLKSENQNQSQAVNTYKSEVSKIENKMEQYRKLLTIIEERSSELQSQKKTTEQQLTSLRHDYDGLMERIRTYNKECDAVKRTLDETRSLHKKSESNMSKKVKELEYLKKELNDCSGLLSEEKLKNRDLLQDIKKLREQSNALVENVLKKMDADFKKELLSVGNSVAIACAKNSQCPPQDLRQFRDTVSSLLTIELKNENKALNDEINQNFYRGLKTLEDRLKDVFSIDFGKLNQKICELSQIESSLNALTKKLQDAGALDLREFPQKPNDALQTSVTDVLKAVRLVAENLKQYKEQVDFVGSYEKKIDGLQERLQTVALQKSEAVALMKTRDMEIEDLSNQVLDKANSLGKLSGEGEELRMHQVRIEQALEIKDQELSKIKQELDMARANSENKLRAQCEILKLVSCERDRLKSFVEEINACKGEAEREKSSAKNKAKKVNEQIQNLNVEVIQLKAKELELDEENRKLRNTLEQFNLDARESGDQVREYKRRVVLLEDDQSAKANNLLEYQDKISLLEQQLQTARKQIQSLKDQRHKVPHVKNHRQESTQQQQHLQRRGSPEVTTGIAAAQQQYREEDEFDLSSSPNDDLEMTNPSPITTRPFKNRTETSLGKTVASTKKKKLLLLEGLDNMESKHSGRKKRKV